MSLRSRLVRGSLYTLFSSLLSLVFAMVTTIIYARLLNPGNFGVLGIFLALGATIGPFAGLGLNVAAMKFVAEGRSKETHETELLLNVGLAITLGSGLALSFGYFVFAQSLAAFYGQPVLVVMIRLSAAVLLISALGTFAQAVIQGLQEMRKLSLLNIAMQGLAVPITFISVNLFGLPGAAVGGVVFVCAVFASSFTLTRSLLRRRGLQLRPRWDLPIAKRLLRFSAPLLFASISTRLALLIVASLLALWLTYNDLGYYRAASSLYRVVLVLPGVLNVSLLPAMSEAYATQKAERTRNQLTQLVRLSMILSLPIALIVGFGAPFWISLLYGSSYTPGAILLFTLSLATVVDVLAIECESTFIGSGRTWLAFALSAGQMVTLVAVSLFLVPAIGVTGAAFAVVISSILYLCVAIAILRKHHELALRELWDVALLCSGILCASAGTFALWGFANPVVFGTIFAIASVLLVVTSKPKDRQLVAAALRMSVGILGGRKET